MHAIITKQSENVQCFKKCQPVLEDHSQPANIGPHDLLGTSPSKVPRTSPKDPIGPSRGRLNLTSRGRRNLTCWGRPEMTSRGRLNLTFKGCPWEVDSGRLDSGSPQDVLRVLKLGCPKYLSTFLSELI